MRSGADCAETRALLALLVGNEDRAQFELRSLRPIERTALARAGRRLAELASASETDRPPWTE